MSLRDRKKEQTRRTLLKVAGKLFSEKDFDDVLVSDIVESANISQKTFFNYYASKSALLEALLLDWLQEANYWAHDPKAPVDLESAIVPPNLEEMQEWMVENRQILKKIMQHTELFSSIYYPRDLSDNRNVLFPTEYRKPRLEKIRHAQKLGFIREDVAADFVCEMYDFLRMDIVQRWLALPDEQATSADFRRMYDDMLKVLLTGLRPSVL